MQAENWNDFQTFLVIAQEGLLMRAAKRLGVDATTVGRRLRRLEVRLGQTLFEQTPAGQVLTEAGEALMASVEAMANAAATIATPDHAADGPVGTLRISVSEGWGTWFLAPRLPDFATRYPGLTIDLVASSSYLNLSRREADVAVFLSRPKVGQLVARKLASFTLRLYASQNYLAQRGTPTTLAALVDHRLVGYIPDLLNAPELRYADEIYRGAKAMLRSSSINAQFEMIHGHGGIGVLPCFIGDSTPDLVRVLPEHAFDRNFWLVTHQDTQRLLKVRVFGEWLRDALAEGGAQQMLGNQEGPGASLVP